jgi:DNA-binding CsgD family transcriptional regulator
MRTLQHQPAVTLTHDGMIVFLWKSGLDTFEISKRIGLHESQVANRLWKLRSAA